MPRAHNFLKTRNVKSSDGQSAAFFASVPSTAGSRDFGLRAVAALVRYFPTRILAGCQLRSLAVGAISAYGPGWKLRSSRSALAVSLPQVFDFCKTV